MVGTGLKVTALHRPHKASPPPPSLTGRRSRSALTRRRSQGVASPAVAHGASPPSPSLTRRRLPRRRSQGVSVVKSQ